MSAIGWIDFDEAERQRAQRLMQLFTEQDTRDELGLGAIRDSIADHLFPGTSTVQTRLRYMLFVPWIFSRLTARSDAREVAEQARADQIRLRNALVAGKQDNGVRERGLQAEEAPGQRLLVGPASLGHPAVPRLDRGVCGVAAGLVQGRREGPHGR